jgi:hypothetical protein
VSVRQPRPNLSVPLLSLPLGLFPRSGQEPIPPSLASRTKGALQESRGCFGLPPAPPRERVFFRGRKRETK